MGEQKSTTLNSRIRLRTDFADVWESNGDSFIPLDGEAVIYKYRTGSAPKLKLGDGIKALKQLPFISDYQNATQYTNGLMSAADKKKLNTYPATYVAPEIYVLPAATTSSMGGIIVGKNLNVDENGILSANAQTYNEATVSSAGLMSANDKLKLTGISANAEVNQNAFSSVTDGVTTIVADQKQDVLTFFAGEGISIALDATNDKITIGSTIEAITASKIDEIVGNSLNS